MRSRSIVRTTLFGVLAIILVVGAQAQTTGQYPRWKVMEEFTSATCPPCAAATPEVNAVADLSKRQLVIKIHVPIPVAGDPWYEMNAAQVRQRMQYYTINSAPSSIMGGTSAQNPHPSAGGRNAMQNTFNSMPPTSFLDINVEQKGGEVEVTVTADRAFSNATLQFMTMVHDVSWPDIVVPNHNGEMEFKYIYMFSYPDAGGTPVSMGAGETRTFTFKPAIGSGKVWDGDVYAIAFVQDNGTKEIMQAGFTGVKNDPAAFSYLKGSSVVASINDNYQRVDRGAKATQEITLNNTGTDAVTVDLAITNLEAIENSGMAATITPSTITVPAGQTLTTSLEVTGAADRSVLTAIEASMASSDGLGASVPTVYYLVNGGRVANYYGVGDANMSAVTAVANINSTYGKDVVYMPYATQFLNAYPMRDFDAAVIAFTDSWTNFRGSVLTDVQAMLTAGKGVWVLGQANMYAAFDRYATNAAFDASRAFYRNVLGIELGSFPFRVTTNSNGQITAVNTFQVKGTNGDPIGDGMSLTANQYSQAWPFYTAGTDVIRLTNGSASSSSIYYDNTAGNIGVVRAQTSTGGKIIYGSLGMEAISSAALRTQYAQKSLDWLLGDGGGDAPEISTNTNDLNFGSVDVGATKTLSITVTNTGKAELEITGVELGGGADAAYFNIASGRPVAGQTIKVAPNATHQISIEFMPTRAASHTAAVEIASNAGTKTVALRGVSVVTSVETEVASETGAVALRLVGQNPVVDRTAIELRGTQSTTVTLIDASGRAVGTLFNGTPSGAEMIELTASELVSGTYSIVATTGTESAVLTVVVTR